MKTKNSPPLWLGRVPDNFLVPDATGYEALNDAPRVFRGVDGVYEVWLWSFDGLREEIIDVGESRDIGFRLKTHERLPEWLARAKAAGNREIKVRVRPTFSGQPLHFRDATRKATEWICWHAYDALGNQLCSRMP